MIEWACERWKIPFENEDQIIGEEDDPDDGDEQE